MFKSKLQELCQRKSWGLPEYSTIKHGLDHSPRFTATVTVNGVRFDTADQSRTAKEAQNNAAKLAFYHLSASVPNPNSNENPKPSQPLPVTGVSTAPIQAPSSAPIQAPPQPSPVTGVSRAPMQAPSCDAPHLYKNRLQTYAQKKNLVLPEYSCQREGPVHACRFKSAVKFDGNTYECKEFFPTIKEAEHAAAKVAWDSLVANEVGEDDGTLYKNLLQELAQKKGFLFPTYETTVSGPPHMPIFVSTVEIGGQYFQGQPRQIKKQAEMSAAKVAFMGLQERRKNKEEQKTGCNEPLLTKDSGSFNLMPVDLPSGSQIRDALERSSSILKSVIPHDLQQNVSLEGNLVIRKEQYERDGSEEKFSSELTTLEAEVGASHAPVLSPEVDINGKRHRCSNSSHDSYDPEEVEFLSPVESSQGPAVGAGGLNTSTRGKVFVYTRSQLVALPDGATMLPCSDDQCVAFRIT